MAVLRKEFRTESRSRNAASTAGLFGVVTVFTVAFATLNSKLNGDIASGLIWVAILFSAVIALPRVFLLEEEQGTGDLLRLFARPHAVFWGKAIFNFLQVLIVSAVLSVLFFGFTDFPVQTGWLYWLTITGGSAAMAGAVTLSGAIVARAANRSAVAAAVSVPILLPVMSMGVSGMRAAFGVGFMEGGTFAALGLLAYAVLTLAIGPWLYAAIWKQ
jgi:heme exporter protein B